MTDLFQKANEAVLRTAGAETEWEEQSSYLGRPATTIAGVALNGSIATSLGIDLRKEVHRRSVSVSIKTSSLTDTYTLTLDGTSVNYDAAAGGALDDGDVLNGLKAAVVGNGTTNVLVTVETYDDDDDGIDDRLEIVGQGEDDFSVAWSSSSAGELAIEADASSCDYVVWLVPEGSKSPLVWRKAGNGLFTGVDSSGEDRRFNTASRSRLYAQLKNILGHASDGGDVTYRARVWVGRGLV